MIDDRIMPVRDRDFDEDEYIAGRKAGRAEAPKPGMERSPSYRWGWLRGAVRAGVLKPTPELIELERLSDERDARVRFPKPVNRRCQACPTIFKASTVGEVYCPACVKRATRS